MNEKTLNAKIEKLAERKASDHVDGIFEACRSLTNVHGKFKDSAWFTKTLIEVMRLYVENLAQGGNWPSLPRSAELVDYYRAKILEEILEKIPLIEELATMRDDVEALKEQADDE